MHEYNLINPKKEADKIMWSKFCKYYTDFFSDPEKKRFNRKEAAQISGYSSSRIEKLCDFINQQKNNGLLLSSEGFFYDPEEK